MYRKGQLVISFIFILFALTFSAYIFIVGAGAQTDGRKQPDMLKLAPEAKLGAVMFNHTAHTTKYSVDGTNMIACVNCHHTAQPMAEAVKHPPHKTVWPADRTTTLTADLFEKDATAPPVNGCRDCHARTDEKPKLLDAIPQLKVEGEAEAVTMNNQQAFHRNCGGCHDEVAKKKADSTAPTSKKCTVCHKKAAAA
jgi:cytochrome c553